MFLHALVMAVIVWINNCICPMWLKWSVYLGSPLIAGAINGLILGDLQYGLVFGATIMMVFMGISVVGGAVPSDVNLAGYVGVTVSMIAKVDPSIGVTVSATLGALGAIANPLLMTLNSMWVHRADKYAEEGNTNGIFYMNVLAPMGIAFVLYFIPSFIIIYFGAPILDAAMAVIPAWLLTGFVTVGKLLPALGLALLMQLLFKKAMLPFFMFGFVMSAYLNLGIVPIAIIGAGIAVLHYMYSQKGGAQA